MLPRKEGQVRIEVDALNRRTVQGGDDVWGVGWLDALVKHSARFDADQRSSAA